MNPNQQRSDFSDYLELWNSIDDVVQGKDLHRHLRSLKRYMKNQEGIMADDLRQREYENNAVFYNVTGYTLNGLIGTMFRKEASLVLPNVLVYIENNIDGKGNGIQQHSRKTASEVIKKGRCGLWVDYPEMETETSLADAELITATIHRFEAQQIISWRTRLIGSQMVLDQILLRYTTEVPKEDGYGFKDQEIILELKLVDDDGRLVYRTQEFHRNTENEGADAWVAQDEKTPRNRNGESINYIPFIFCGSENNDPAIDHPPLADMAKLNIAHYRNSADYEDNVWYAGQTQPWMSGATEEFYDMIEKHEIRIGSRILFPVPEGQTFGFATPDPNPQSRQAMLDKVEMMIGIGARFITPGGAAKTAYEAESDREVSHSILSTIADNISRAYTTCLIWMMDFMPDSPESEILFEIDSDFSDVGSTPQLLAAWVKSYLDGAVPQDQYINWMQRQGYFDATEDPEMIAERLNSEGEDPINPPAVPASQLSEV